MNEKREERWTFFYDTDWIAKEVENITTTIASVPVGANGEKRMWLAMTEDHADLFQRFVKDAMADVRTACVRWVEPEHPSNDMRRIDRLHLHTKLWLKDVEGFPARVRVIDDRIRDYLIWRVVGMWFLLKSPKEAMEIYLPKAQGVLDDIADQFKSCEGNGGRRRYHLY